MLLVLAVLFTPLSVCLAGYRLFTIPIRLKSGTLRLNTSQSLMPVALALLAYLVLLAYTVSFCIGVLQCVFANTPDISKLMRLLVYFEVFPIFYVLAESRFFYGFQTAPLPSQVSHGVMDVLNNPSPN